MCQIIETLDESASRSEFHRAVMKFGYDRVKVELVKVDGGCPIYRITISN
jgi:hypothetical protein